MNNIYIIESAIYFQSIPNTPLTYIPDNYDDIVSLVLSYSGKTNVNARPSLMFAINNYFRFQPHRSLKTFWNDAIDEVKKKQLIMWEGNLPPINAKHFLYAIVKIVKDNNALILDTANKRVFLPDGRILPENKAQEWHEQIQEMMVFGQQQMDVGFPQSNSLMRKYFAEQLTPQIIDLGFILESLKKRSPQMNSNNIEMMLNAGEPDIVFSHPEYDCQLRIGLDGQCGMYEIFADLIFHQATEQIAQLFNQNFTGSELTISVNQLLNWQLPVDYRSIRSFDDVKHFVELFNQRLIPLLKQLVM